MKGFIKVVGLVILCVLLTLFITQHLFTQEKQKVNPHRLTESKDTIAQDTYVSEVIVQAQWGEKNLYKYAGGEESKPGEFGYYTSEETEIAPVHFTVAPNGEIYISDPLNKRIQKFSPEGVFISVIPIMGGEMCVDKDNNIYFLTSHWGENKKEWFINKYDQNGSLLQSYPIEMERRQMWSIHCNNSGGVFMQFYQFRIAEKDTILFGFCQVGSSADAFSLEEQKRTFREGSLGYNSVSVERNIYYKGGRLLSFSGDTVETFKSIQGEFLGCDDSLNAYTLKTIEDKPRDYILLKYDQEGRLVGSWNLSNSPPYVVTERPEYLDCKGNFYLFVYSGKEGIQIIKWHKQ